jgi:D-alanyl-D-alanine endopeptidase (penicillin-binding protein 7)
MNSRHQELVERARTTRVIPCGKVGRPAFSAVFQGGFVRPVALSPALAPARSRLGKALPGFVLSVLLLHAGTFLPRETVLGTGSGVAEAATATAKSKKKTTTSKKRTTTRKKTRSKSRYARVRPANYVNARAALLIDAQTGEVLYDKNSGTPMPIASLTKLMTAMVYLESKPDLGKRVMVSREDLAGSGKSQLRTGEVLTMRDLLHASLLSSDNAATKSLVRNSGIEPEEYLARMNRKSSVMGLANTHFVEFTGLSEQNVSSAAEYAQILKTAALHPLIAHITTLPDYTFRTSKRDHHLVNTNRLCRYGIFDVKGGKTGFINESGYCVATWVSTATRDVIAVILGAPSNPARFAEARRLIDRLAVAPVASARGI